MVVLLVLLALALAFAVSLRGDAARGYYKLRGCLDEAAAALRRSTSRWVEENDRALKAEQSAAGFRISLENMTRDLVAAREARDEWERRFHNLEASLRGLLSDDGGKGSGTG